MSFMDTAFIDTWLINTYGQTIKIYNRVFEKDANNNITNEYYSDTIETIGWVIPFSSEREIYGNFGYRVEGDFSCCVATGTSVNVNDKVLLVDNTELEIREIISHYEFSRVAYKELILRKEV